MRRGRRGAEAEWRLSRTPVTRWSHAVTFGRGGKVVLLTDDPALAKRVSQVHGWPTVTFPTATSQRCADCGVAHLEGRRA